MMEKTLTLPALSGWVPPSPASAGEVSYRDISAYSPPFSIERL